MLKSIESPKFVSRKARILGEFDLRKNLQPTKLEEGPQVFVKKGLTVVQYKVV